MKTQVDEGQLQPIFNKGINVRSLFIVIAAVALWLMAFAPAISNAVHMWYTDTTFNHCFFVIPAALYFGFKEWHRLDFTNTEYDFLAVVGGLALVALWGIGYAANVQLFVHIATFMILPLMLWFCIGRKNALILWFPLSFPLFAVPFGSELIVPFQGITADLAVKLLDVFGIPTYRTGLYIEVPSGKFEVAEACAGVRFFIASLCFGYFYAYISYRCLYKRILFVLFSAILPILANGVRVFGTIVVGEKIGMEYAAGADHLVYGWVFFAIVLLLLVWVGSFWQDKYRDEPIPKHNLGSKLYFPLWVLLPLLIIIAWKAVIDTAVPVSSQLLDVNVLELRQISINGSGWKPQFSGATDKVSGLEENTGLQLFVAAYRDDSEGRELISFNNRFYRPGVWTLERKRQVNLKAPDTDRVSAVQLLELRSANGQHRAVFYWYKLPGYTGASALQVKLRQALGKLTGRQLPTAVVVLSKDYDPLEYQAMLDDVASLTAAIEKMTKSLE